MKVDTVTLVGNWFHPDVHNYNDLREKTYGTAAIHGQEGDNRSNAALKKRVEGMVIGPVVNLKDKNGKKVTPRMPALCEQGETVYHGDKASNDGKPKVTKRWVLKETLAGTRTTSTTTQEELFAKFPHLAQYK
jgi:hypothetical protein